MGDSREATHGGGQGEVKGYSYVTLGRYRARSANILIMYDFFNLVFNTSFTENLSENFPY